MRVLRKEVRLEVRAVAAPEVRVRERTAVRVQSVGVHVSHPPQRQLETTHKKQTQNSGCDHLIAKCGLGSLVRLILLLYWYL